ncbi:MAG: YIP1 family protein [Chloroflexota bacterium]|nr:YIP1 family protein [Chloroflexota bacterium]MDE2839043.1 YIP1 family protein [Chloroflexota bacterium]MDE2929588.1 YIP1 family protein [Chloroflexota bacterium]
MLFDRMFRAAMLDPLVFDEIKEDRESMTQAVQVIIIVFAIGIISTIVQTVNAPADTGTQTDLSTNIATSGATAILGWLLWAFLAYLLGTGVFGGTGSYVEMLRAIAFAQAPSVITILSVPLVFIPAAGAILGGLLGLAAALWVLMVNVIATRQTLGISTGKATIITVIVTIVMVVTFVAITFALFPENFQLDSIQ